MMKLVTFVILVLVALAAVPGSSEAQPGHGNVLTQEEAPIAIEGYEADYQRDGGRFSTEGIRHRLRYRNVSDQTIVAVRFGLVAFNAFNEFQDRLGGFTMDRMPPNDDKNGTWVSHAGGGGPAFYTGVAYVDRVRFADGTVWRSGEGVLEDLRAFDASLTEETTNSWR